MGDTDRNLTFFVSCFANAVCKKDNLANSISASLANELQMIYDI